MKFDTIAISEPLDHEPFQIAAGCLIVKQDRPNVYEVLAIKRADGQGWGLPCGKENSHWPSLEIPKQTAVRETLEETGFHAQIVEDIAPFVFRQPIGNTEVWIFLAHVDFENQEMPETPEEGDWAWIAPSVLLNGAYKHTNRALFAYFGIL
jgi:8-oxo-dGTP pyrophosphatase MutT (NUDIX family)